MVDKQNTKLVRKLFIAPDVNVVLNLPRPRKMGVGLGEVGYVLGQVSIQSAEGEAMQP